MACVDELPLALGVRDEQIHALHSFLLIYTRCSDQDFTLQQPHMLHYIKKIVKAKGMPFKGYCEMHSLCEDKYQISFSKSKSSFTKS